MGMYNAIIDDELLNTTGIYKERLSQSALYAEMLKRLRRRGGCRLRLADDAGMTFQYGEDEATELTDGAGAVAAEDVHRRPPHRRRLRARRGRHPVPAGSEGPGPGIRSRRGHPELRRPPAGDLSRDGSRVLYEGRALPHFNEADEGVAVDALSPTGSGGDGARPRQHAARRALGRGVRRTSSSGCTRSRAPCRPRTSRRLGGRRELAPGAHVLPGRRRRRINGVSKPGEIVWSRVYIADGMLQADICRASVVELPAEETEAPQGRHEPGVADHARGAARHHARPVHGAAQGQPCQVAYAPDAATADKALIAKAAAFAALGIEVHLCGETTMTQR